MKSHQQLVEEWKEKLREAYDGRSNPKQPLPQSYIESLIERSMLASAKGAAEAGKAERLDGLTERNMTISYIEHQLKDYFEEV